MALQSLKWEEVGVNGLVKPRQISTRKPIVPLRFKTMLKSTLFSNNDLSIIFTMYWLLITKRLHIVYCLFVAHHTASMSSWHWGYIKVSKEGSICPVKSKNRHQLKSKWKWSSSLRLKQSSIPKLWINCLHHCLN